MCLLGEEEVDVGLSVNNAMLRQAFAFVVVVVIALVLQAYDAIDLSRLIPVSMSLRLSLLRPRMPSVMAGRSSSIRSQSTHASRPFSYRLGASSSGKSSPVAPRSDINTFAHPLLDGDDAYLTSVSRYSGEDAFFMARVARSDRHVVFGLADGVGGWRDSGVDPGEYSHGLCKYMAQRTRRPEAEADLKPRNLLQHGYDKVMNDGNIAAGGCTACIASAEPSGSLEVAK
jgi:protein phosphatase PTC7